MIVWEKKLWSHWWVAIVVAVAVIGTTPIGCDRSAAPDPHQTDPSPTNPSDPPDQAPATQPQPALTLPRIDLRGLHALIEGCAQQEQVLIIDFWATWCRPCVALFPKLHQALKPLGNRVRVVSVTLDAPGLYESRAVRFLQSHHATQDAYLLVAQPQARSRVVAQLGRRWQDLVVPAVLVYDVHGNLAAEFLGGEAEASPITTKVQTLLDQALTSTRNQR